MSNPNIFTVYSPTGDVVETSRANARDLVTHAGWSTSPFTNVEPAAEAKEEADASTDSEGSVEDAETEASEGEAEAGETSAEEDEEQVYVSESGPAFYTTEAQFDHLETREALVEYLAGNFPEFKPHHKSSRDGLVAKAIELATA